MPASPPRRPIADSTMPPVALPRHAELPVDLERKLIAIWEEVLGRPVSATDDFFSLGGRSLVAARLFVRIREQLQISLPPDILLEAPTVERLSRKLSEGTCRNSPLVAIQPQGKLPPVFFIHGADGSVFYYRRLAAHLGFHQPFYGLQASAPGELPGSNEELAARYIAEVRAVQPHGPYFLGGYCMGGTIALEMARQLRTSGEAVGLLALVDTYDWTRIAPTGLQQLAFLAQKLEFHGRNVLRLPAREAVTFLREKARWGTDLVSEWWRRRNTVDGNRPGAAIYRLLTEYVPGFFPGRLTHFRSMATYNPYLGKELSVGVHADSIEIVEIPVYPGGILVEPFVRRLAESMRGRLDAAGAISGDLTRVAEPPDL